MIKAAAVWAMTMAGTELAAEDTRCGSYQQVVAYLAENWGEIPIATSLDQTAQAFVFFANLQTGTWTIVVTNLNDVSCMVIDGNDFSFIEGIRL